MDYVDVASVLSKGKGANRQSPLIVDQSAGSRPLLGEQGLVASSAELGDARVIRFVNAGDANAGPATRAQASRAASQAL